MEHHHLTALIKYLQEFRQGNHTMEDAKRVFNALSNDPQPLLDELNGMTKAELGRFVYIRGGETKADMVRSAFDSLHLRFALDSISYSPFQEKYSDAVKRIVNAQTEADLQAFVAENKAERESKQKALTNPETLDEFRDFISAKGTKELSDEQLGRYDMLVAKSRLEYAKKDLERKLVVKAVDTGGTSMEMVKTVHTKKGTDIWVVKLGDRVERDTYTALNTAAKRLGGYYSSFRGGGAVPGFQFQTLEAAEQFMALQQGDVQKADNTAQKLARVGDRFRDMAERLEEKGDDILNANRKVNTHRRAAMASGMEDRAVKMIGEAKILDALADAMDAGQMGVLQFMRSAMDLRDLQSILRRAKYKRYREEKLKDDVPTDFEKDVRYVQYPFPSLWVDHINSWVRDIEKQKGYKNIVKWLEKIAAWAKKEDKSEAILSSSTDIENYKKLVQGLNKNGLRADWLKQEGATYDRMQRMGIDNVVILRAALRELHAITSGKGSIDEERKVELELKQAERKFIGTNVDGFFPTPAELAEELIEQADIRPGMRVLEPSAGIGHIADLIKAAHPDAVLDVVEMQYAMREFLQKKGHNVIDTDVFDLSEPVYDRIVMNPPFEKLADIDHVRHAFTLLKAGGRLVAIMAANKEGSSTKVRDFKEFVDEYGTIDNNPAGAFKSAFRPTGVNTVTVLLDKPAEMPKAELFDMVEQTAQPTMQPPTPDLARARAYAYAQAQRLRLLALEY